MHSCSTSRVLLGCFSLAALGLTACEECPDRPPPCLDDAFYDLDPVTETESPIGAAVVVAVGTDVVRVSMLDTDEDGAFFSLPAVPDLEAGDEVLVEYDGGGYLVSRDGEPKFFTGGGPVVYGPRLTEPVAGVDAQLTEACRAPSVDGQCFFGTTVYALVIGEVRIDPGQTADVDLPDGRRATVWNRVINRGTASCHGCLDLPPSNFLVDFVFH